jgi:hypothetical protein
MSFQNIITNLKDYQQTHLINVWVPSVQKEIPFKPLTINQQTEIISAIGFDGITSPLTINRVINNIAIDNSTTADSLMVYDKYHILIGLRIAALGNKVDGMGGELVVPPTKTTNTQKIINEGDISVKCIIPTLQEENKVITKLITETKNENITKPGELVSLLYIGEIIKFVDTVTVGEVTIKFSDIQYRDRKDIINNLPLSINNQIVQYIQEIRQIEGNCMVIGDKKLTIDQLFVTK